MFRGPPGGGGGAHKSFGERTNQIFDQIWFHCCEAELSEHMTQDDSSDGKSTRLDFADTNAH